MTTTYTIAANRSATVRLEMGCVMSISGAGTALMNDRRYKLTAAAQKIGPFKEQRTIHISATGTTSWHIYDLWQHAGMPRVLNSGAANYDVSAEDVGAYVRMTATGAKTATVRPEATEAMPESGEWHLRNAAASGDITLTEGAGVTLNVPAGGTLVLEPGMTVTLKRVAADEFDVIGLTVAA